MFLWAITGSQITIWGQETRGLDNMLAEIWSLLHGNSQLDLDSDQLGARAGCTRISWEFLNSVISQRSCTGHNLDIFHVRTVLSQQNRDFLMEYKSRKRNQPGRRNAVKRQGAAQSTENISRCWKGKDISGCCLQMWENCFGSNTDKLYSNVPKLWEVVSYAEEGRAGLLRNCRWKVRRLTWRLNRIAPMCTCFGNPTS